MVHKESLGVLVTPPDLAPSTPKTKIIKDYNLSPLYSPAEIDIKNIIQGGRTRSASRRSLNPVKTPDSNKRNSRSASPRNCHNYSAKEEPLTPLSTPDSRDYALRSASPSTDRNGRMKGRLLTPEPALDALDYDTVTANRSNIRGRLANKQIEPDYFGGKWTKTMARLLDDDDIEACDNTRKNVELPEDYLDHLRTPVMDSTDKDETENSESDYNESDADETESDESDSDELDPEGTICLVRAFHARNSHTPTPQAPTIKKIGDAGELHVFETLKSLNLPDFSLSNWVRGTTDIIYSDTDEVLTRYLQSHCFGDFPFIKASPFRDFQPIEYLIEVKSTTHRTPNKQFDMGENQYDLMMEHQVKSDQRPTKIYILVRVFNLLLDAKMRFFVDPPHYSETEIRIKAERRRISVKHIGSGRDVKSVLRRKRSMNKYMIG